MSTIPACTKCGTQMERRIEPIRLPEFFLKCPSCGLVVDMTPDQYYGRAPEPDWNKP